jgi:hypothetical protein
VKQDVERTRMDWCSKRVTIVPCAALGDVTIYLRLAWLFHLAGAHVRFVARTLHPAREYFDWLQVESGLEVDLLALSRESDLVISYVNWLIEDAERAPQLLETSNIAFVSAKKLPSALGIDGREVRVGEQLIPGASRAICLRSRDGRSMVQWVDEYAASVYGLLSGEPLALRCPATCRDAPRRVVIFPTTPQEKKNYSPTGFRWLARRLQRQGWLVEFVGMPHERDILSSSYRGFPVHAFADVRGLMDFLATCAVVVSNDSGGGHLGSLMGLRTFTITRKNSRFVWRPGFNELNRVLTPMASFKLAGRYVWRPFIPVWRIAAMLGRAR